MGKVIKGQINKFDLKFRIFISFFTISVIAVVVTSALSFRSFETYMEDKIRVLAQARLDIVSNVYSKQTEQYWQMAYAIYNSPNAASVLKNTSVTPNQKGDISRYISSLLSSSNSIDCVFLYSDDQIVHEFDFKYQSPETKLGILEQVRLTTKDTEVINYTTQDNVLKLAVFCGLRDNLYGQSRQGVVLVLDANSLSKNIFSSNAINNDLIYIIDKNAQVLLSQNPGKKFNSGIISSLENINNNSGYFIFSEDKEHLMVSYTRSQDGEYFVLSLIDYKESIVELTQMRNFTIFLTLLIIFGLLLLLYFITLRLYAPVNNMLINIRDSFEKKDDIRQKSDFDYAETIINRAATRIKDLESEQQANKLLDYLLCENYVQNDSPLPQPLADIERKFEKGCVCRVLLLLNTSEKDNGFSLLCNESISGIINNNLELISDSIRLDSSQILIFLSDSGTKNKSQCSEKEINFFCHSFIKNIRAIISNDIFLAYSSDISEFKYLKSEYNRLAYLLKYIIFNPQIPVYSPDFSTKHITPETIRSAGDKIKEILLGEEVDEIDAYVEIILERIKNSNYDQALSLLASLLSDSKTLSLNIENNSSEYMSSYLDNYLRISSFATNHELKAFLKQDLRNAWMELHIAKSKKVQMYMIDAIEYINENYDDSSLSIDFLADRYNISPSYFSRLFNNYTNKPLPEYLNSLRLQKAVDLLQNKNLQINEIASQVGFSSSSYFTSLFKKKYGMAPSQYKLNLKNNST